MASLFGITSADIEAKLVPSGGDYAFSIGGGGDLSDAACLEIVEMAEARVLGALPVRYAELCRRVPGEVLVASAAAGQTTARVRLWPVSAGTLMLYKNFPRDRAWDERRPGDVMTSPAWTANLATGEITFAAALDEGDVVWATYEHTAAPRLLWLKECAKSFAAVEIARRFAFFRTADGFERFGDWERDAALSLDRVARRESSGVDLLDGLPLVGAVRGVSLTDILG